jgi:hypothetical protein
LNYLCTPVLIREKQRKSSKFSLSFEERKNFKKQIKSFGLLNKTITFATASKQSKTF